MKKAAIGILVVLLLAIGGLLGMASTQPDAIHVERSITITALAVDMAPFAEDLEKVNLWSPWEEKDPNVQKSYSDSKSGVGAWYAWEGNEDVGRGKQTITSTEPGKVVHRLEFYEPFEDQADATITYAMVDGTLNVTWSFDQEAGFSTKVMTVFMDMDEMLGPDFDKGLGMLKPLVEAAAASRIDQELIEAEAALRAETEPQDEGAAAP